MENQRKHIRFIPDDHTFILVNLEDSNETLCGLCVSESQGGCSGLFLNHNGFKAGEMVYIKVGKLESVAAEIRWVTELDKDCVKIGFAYLS